MNKRVFHIYRYISGVLLMAGLFGLQAADVIRKAAVAGQFYTANPSALKKEMETYFAGASQLQAPARLLVSPHAGYVFSGPVAGKGFAAIDKNVKKVIIIGPSHHALINGLAVTDATWYETPLGKVKVDQDLRDRLKKSPLVCSARGAEDPEHCIEVQLPFLQMKLTVYIFAHHHRRIDPAQAAELLFPLIDKETLVIASSDLSHYQHQKEARRIDDRSIETILSGDAMGFIDGCGETPVRIVMHLGRKMGLKPVKLSMRGHPLKQLHLMALSRRLSAPPLPGLNPVQSKRKSVLKSHPCLPELKKYLQSGEGEHGTGGERDEATGCRQCSISSEKEQRLLCTLTINGNLRGCIGYIEPIKPLYQAVIDNARSAVLSDPRFSPVRQDELGKINVEVSVLSNPVPLEFKTPDDLLQKLKPGVHGVILQKGPYHSTFLPQVWEQLPDKIMFLEHLSMKGGMARDGWKTSEVRTYTAEHFQE